MPRHDFKNQRQQFLVFIGLESFFSLNIDHLAIPPLDNHINLTYRNFFNLLKILGV
jgi:hypothetical protein